MVFLSILAGLAIVALLNLINPPKKTSVQIIEEAEEAKSDEELKVLAILQAALKSLTIQNGAGYGPWLSAMIEKGDGDPATALTAVRWTIRDMMSRPFECDAPYIKGPHFDMGGLVRAERALEELTGAGV